MSGIDGKYFAVTGAASGIGQATSIRLADLGAAGIAISDIDEKGLANTRGLCMTLEYLILSSLIEYRQRLH
jgi:NAD(P)-dependent dehydrogenase (short-subunit alcohol dehydrogenase family)